MKEYWIMGIRIRNRNQEVTQVQEVLTMFGCSVRTRLGLHESGEDYDSPSGTILLELTGNPEEFTKMEQELLKIEGVEVRKMIFSF